MSKSILGQKVTSKSNPPVSPNVHLIWIFSYSRSIWNIQSASTVHFILQKGVFNVLGTPLVPNFEHNAYGKILLWRVHYDPLAQMCDMQEFLVLTGPSH